MTCFTDDPLVVNCKILLEAVITGEDVERCLPRGFFFLLRKDPFQEKLEFTRPSPPIGVTGVTNRTKALPHFIYLFILLVFLFFFLKGGRCNCNDVCWLLYGTKTDVSFFYCCRPREGFTVDCGVTTLFFNFNRFLEPASEDSKVDRVCDALRRTLETAEHNKYVKTEFHRKKG